MAIKVGNLKNNTIHFRDILYNATNIIVQRVLMIISRNKASKNCSVNVRYFSLRQKQNKCSRKLKKF